MPSHLDHPATAGMGLDPGPGLLRRQMPLGAEQTAAMDTAGAFGFTAPLGIGLGGIAGAACSVPADMSTEARMARTNEQGLAGPHCHGAGYGLAGFRSPAAAGGGIGLGAAQPAGDR